MDPQALQYVRAIKNIVESSYRRKRFYRFGLMAFCSIQPQAKNNDTQLTAFAFLVSEVLFLLPLSA